MKEKICCLAGDFSIQKNLNIEDKLEKTLIEAINQNYRTFYIGNNGYFDILCVQILLDLKQYFDIKIVKIFSDRHKFFDKQTFPEFDDYIYLDLDKIHYKRRKILRNKWIIENLDLLICHTFETYHGFDYRMLKYAKQLKIKIIII